MLALIYLCECDSLEALAVPCGGLGVVLLQDLSVLSDKALLLQLDNGCLLALVLLLLADLFELELPLRAVDRELLLPEALDLALVLLLPHAALLRVHLLKTLVVCKLLHELLFEFVLHPALLGLALDLQPLLVGLRGEQVLFGLLALL